MGYYFTSIHTSTSSSASAFLSRTPAAIICLNSQRSGEEILLISYLRYYFEYLLLLRTQNHFCLLVLHLPISLLSPIVFNSQRRKEGVGAANRSIGIPSFVYFILSPVATLELNLINYLLPIPKLHSKCIVIKSLTQSDLYSEPDSNPLQFPDPHLWCSDWSSAHCRKSPWPWPADPSS